MTREFLGRSTDAQEATLNVTGCEHLMDDNWIRIQTLIGKFNRPFYLRRSDAHALALELLKLSDREGLKTAVFHLETLVAKDEAKAEAVAARKLEVEARRVEERKLNDEATALFEAAYPGASWEDLGREIHNKFRAVAEAARKMYREGV